MRRIGSGAALLALLLLVSGCASSVHTRLNTFMAPEAEFSQGTIAVKAADESLEDSLEFGFYRDKVESRLQGLGYTLAPPEEARYIARLRYGVQEVDYEARQPHVIFTTGFGGYYRHGGFGVLMSDPGRYVEEYVRQVKLTITRTPDAIGGEPRRIYEATAISEGGCPIMSVVFDEMLAAIFQNFPGENGAVTTLRVRGDSRCR